MEGNLTMTFFQERKLLLKKIGTLNERVAEVNLRKSMSPARKATEKCDAAVQVRNDLILLVKSFDLNFFLCQKPRAPENRALEFRAPDFRAPKNV